MSSSTAKNYSVYVQKILMAGSQEEVKQNLVATFNSLIAQNPEKNIIISFTAALINELALLSPTNKDAGQWSTTNMARIYLHQMRKKTEATIPLSLTTYV